MHFWYQVSRPSIVTVWLKRTAHPKCDPTRVWAHDLWIMPFHVPETLILTTCTWPYLCVDYHLSLMLSIGRKSVISLNQIKVSVSLQWFYPASPKFDHFIIHFPGPMPSVWDKLYCISSTLQHWHPIWLPSAGICGMGTWQTLIKLFIKCHGEAE